MFVLNPKKLRCTPSGVLLMSVQSGKSLNFCTPQKLAGKSAFPSSEIISFSEKGFSSFHVKHVRTDI